MAGIHTTDVVTFLIKKIRKSKHNTKTPYRADVVTQYLPLCQIMLHVLIFKHWKCLQRYECVLDCRFLLFIYKGKRLSYSSGFALLFYLHSDKISLYDHYTVKHYITKKTLFYNWSILCITINFHSSMSQRRTISLSVTSKIYR